MNGLELVRTTEGGGDLVLYHGDPDDIFERIKSNDPSLLQLSLCPYNPSPTPDRWAELGNNLGRNTCIEYLDICTDGLDEEEDEIASADNLDIFCRGLSKNRSLKTLMLEYYDFGRSSFELLCPFMIENDKLAKLEFIECNLSVGGINMLSDSFRQCSTPASLKDLTIYGNHINGLAPAVVNVVNQCPRLKRLCLWSNRIGDDDCNAVASLLGTENSKLECLDLHENDISDEGVDILANALTNNKGLKELHLEGNPSITDRGWMAFAKALCNPSSIQSTFQSNHTLEKVWGSPMKQYTMGLPDNLMLCLLTNKEKNKMKVIHEKVISCHLRDNFDLSPFLEMDVKLLPFIMGQVGKVWVYKERLRFSAFYRIIRNIPDLCSYPSRERELCQKLQKEIMALKANDTVLTRSLDQEKAENAALRSENVNLKQQNEQLRSENELLKSNKRQKYVN